MNNNYNDFIKSKENLVLAVGIDIDKNNINSLLFDFQKDIVKWACKKGRCAIFLDTGLGKTFISLEYARLLRKKTIIIAPLSVARQTIREAKKINIDVKYIRHQDEINDHQIYITNYELIDHLDFSIFECLILDESSILKSISGQIKKKIFKIAKNIPFKMACTATPAPNDDSEMGNHAEYLGICSREEMLAEYFIHANLQEEKMMNDKIIRRKLGNKHGQEWRLRNHGRQHFYKWLSSWAISMRTPSDLDYDDDGYILPKLNIHLKIVDVDYRPTGELFFTKLKGITDRTKIRHEFINKRLDLLKSIINSENGNQWIVWTKLQDESTKVYNLLKSLDKNVVEVKGTDTAELKANNIEKFQDKEIDILVTKPKIAGFGMNFQNANNMIFFGIDDSWETFYQAIRREWRFGQDKPVNVYIIITSVEQGIWQNVQRKDTNAKILIKELIDAVKTYEKKELNMNFEDKPEEIKSIRIKEENYELIQGDSCQELPKVKDNSVDLSVYSPPFMELFTYSPSKFDLGNSRNRSEFFEHYSFIIKELLRVTKPGRLTCVHTSDIPALQVKDGYIGVKDFPGDVVEAYKNEGWTFHGRAFVQKNPQAQAIRTHSKALLFAQLRKDSCDSRPALIDQILIFKKAGNNEVPVLPIKNKEIDNEKWIHWAHGIWTDIKETEVLRYTDARNENDEKHICPLQLETIKRCVILYSNPGETILTPFMGIGSEVYTALKHNRKAIGIELKKSYFDLAVRNIDRINVSKNQNELFTKVA